MDDLTRRSHTTPIWGSAGGLNTHWISSLLNTLPILSWFQTSIYSLNSKFVTLSELMTVGLPLLAIDHLSHIMKESVDKENVSFKWTALVTRQVKKQLIKNLSYCSTTAQDTILFSPLIFDKVHSFTHSLDFSWASGRSIDHFTGSRVEFPFAHFNYSINHSLSKNMKSYHKNALTTSEVKNYKIINYCNYIYKKILVTVMNKLFNKWTVKIKVKKPIWSSIPISEVLSTVPL